MYLYGREESTPLLVNSKCVNSELKRTISELLFSGSGQAIALFTAENELSTWAVVCILFFQFYFVFDFIIIFYYLYDEKQRVCFDKYTIWTRAYAYAASCSLHTPQTCWILCLLHKHGNNNENELRLRRVSTVKCYKYSVVFLPAWFAVSSHAD